MHPARRAARWLVAASALAAACPHRTAPTASTRADASARAHGAAPAGVDAGAPFARPATAAPSPPPPLPVGACALVPPRGAVVGTLVERATVAAAGERALLVALDRGPAADGEGAWATHSASLTASQLAAGAAPTWRRAPHGLPAGRHDGAIVQRGVALGDGAQLATGAVAFDSVMVEGWAAQAVLAVTPDAASASPATHALSPHFGPEELAGASRGDGLVVIASSASESLQDGEGLPELGPRALYVAAARGASVRVTAYDAGTAALVGPRAPAVALAPDAAQGGAVAYVRDDVALRVARLDAQGTPVGAPVELARVPAPATRDPFHPLPAAARGMGAPAVAYRGGLLEVVWAQRAAPGAPFALRYAAWDPTAAAPAPAPRPLATGVASAFAPALVAQGGRAALAWMEGDATHGVVRVGVGATLEDAAAHAIAASPPGIDARDPELAASGPRLWLIWQQFAHDRRNAHELRAALIDCH